MNEETVLIFYIPSLYIIMLQTHATNKNLFIPHILTQKFELS